MNQPLGRPRKAALDAAILRAATDLILEEGFNALSVEAVAARAGTTRPAFYRRFDGTPALVLALIQEQFSTDLDVDIDFGNLPADLDAIQHEQVTLFGDPLVKSSFAGFLNALHANTQLGAVFTEQFLGPRRAATAVIIERAEDRGEIPHCTDVEWICDLLTGPLIMRAIIPGLLPLDQHFIANTVNSALSALHYPAAPPRSQDVHTEH